MITVLFGIPACLSKYKAQEETRLYVLLFTLTTDFLLWKYLI